MADGIALRTALQRLLRAGPEVTHQEATLDHC